MAVDNERGAVARPGLHLIGERGLAVRPSIGIVTCPADGNTGAALLKHADTAMHCAKREQTGYAIFSEPADGGVMRLAPKTLAATGLFWGSERTRVGVRPRA